jgi:hypothetical protein
VKRIFGLLSAHGHTPTDESVALPRHGTAGLGISAEPRYLVPLSNGLTARDFWPLVLKLSREERIRLAKLALKAAATDDAAAYRAAPADPDEFGSEDEPLAWEGEGSKDAKG